ncbi:hypothetical protein [Bradyrhizobium sp. CCBAU 53351]|uniref:hypothetical protein n=1 Tax=Bradyrhizobium sp. CCBAU 53351 TaxID=1325114 RepID=UPI001889374F|nr:hypothetical protein [Bradyrhizobium sp. CCBAU 53351]
MAVTRSKLPGVLPSPLYCEARANELSGGRHRHLLDEAGDARIFMRGETRLHMLGDLLGSLPRTRVRLGMGYFSFPSFWFFANEGSRTTRQRIFVANVVANRAKVKR